MNLCTKDKPVRFSYVRIPAPKQSNFFRHMHSEYELLLALSGGASYVIEDKKYILNPYTLLLVPPKAYHFPQIEDTDLYCRYMIAFNEHAAKSSLLKSVYLEPACYQLDEHHPIIESFRQLHALSETDLGEHENLMLKTYCNQILLNILVLQQQTTASKAPAERTLPYPVLPYIEENLTKIKTLDEIAEHFFLSPSTLTHQFKSQMGISLMKFIRQKKLLLARTMLEKGEKPLEVAAKCGFSEYTTFYKAYIRFFGIAPSKSE